VEETIYLEATEFRENTMSALNDIQNALTDPVVPDVETSTPELESIPEPTPESTPDEISLEGRYYPNGDTSGHMFFEFSNGEVKFHSPGLTGISRNGRVTMNCEIDGDNMRLYYLSALSFHCVLSSDRNSFTLQQYGYTTEYVRIENEN
jgi:hypothetical protein